MRAARAAGGGGGKTLYEQLEAEREKQQEAYDANTKALFSPGEVLDAEDVAFYEAEQRRAATARARAPRTGPSSPPRARPPRRRRRRPSSARAGAGAGARRRPAAGRAHPAPARRVAGAGAEAATRRGRRPRGPRRVLVLPSDGDDDRNTRLAWSTAQKRPRPRDWPDRRRSLRGRGETFRTRAPPGGGVATPMRRQWARIWDSERPASSPSSPPSEHPRGDGRTRAGHVGRSLRRL